MKKHTLASFTIGSALAIAAAQSSAESNPFSAQTLGNGYEIASLDKHAEGKCGEGKCGGEMKEKPKKDAEGKCGEGKCGEGQCGEEMKEKHKKDAEGKCGEGKCGNQ